MTRFAGVGLASFVLDTVLVALLAALTGNLAVSVVAARLVSGGANFALNRAAVFRDSAVPVRQAALRYVVLAVAMLTANYVVLSALVGMGVALVPAKVATEATLFGLSYAGQRVVVFAVAAPGRPCEPSKQEADRHRDVVAAVR